MPDYNEYKAMTKVQLAQMYGINVRTFDRWLALADQTGSKGIRRPMTGRIFTPWQVRKIIEILGEP